MAKLILGPLGSGKTVYILNEIRQRIRRGQKDIIIIVPEQSTMMYERTVLRALGNRAGAHVEVLSFLRFARLMFSKYAASGGVYASGSAKQLVMSLAISATAENLTVFRPAAHKSEFAAAMISAVNDLKTYNITPERLLHTREICENERIREKLSDTALIYSAYDAILGRAYADPADDLTRLARLLSSLETLDEVFYIDAFFGFTPQEYLVLEEIFRLCEDVSVALSYDERHKNNELLSMTRHTKEKLCALFERYDRTPGIVSVAKVKNRAPSLEFLSDAFLTGQKSAYEGDAGEIFVAAADDVQSEAEYVCDRISALVQSGARYSDFLILAADISDYELAVSSAFLKHSIPLYADKKESVAEMAPARALLSALSAASHKLSYGELFSCLKLGMGDYTHEEICCLENYVLMWGVSGQNLLKPFTKNPLSRRGYKNDGEAERGKAETARLEEIRRRVMEPFSKLQKAVSGSVTYEKTAEAVFEFMTESGFSGAIENTARAYADAGDLRRSDEYMRIYNTIIDTLDEMAALLSDAPCTAGEFAKLFKAALSEHKLGSLPPTADCVTFSSFERIISPSAPYVAIIGASDGKIPRSGQSGGGLFDEAEREELKSLGMEISKSAYENANYELFLVYCALCAPTRALLITYPTSGNENAPSRVLSGAYERISQLKTVKIRNVPIKDRLYSPERAKELIIGGISDNSSLGAYDRALLSEASRVLSKDERYREWEAGALKFASGTNEARIRRGENRERMIKKDEYLTASRIEKFSSCRFSYFMNYVLNIKKPERSDFTPADTGTFIHYILEAFFYKIMRSKRSLGEFTHEETEALIGECVKEYINSEIYYIDERSARFEYLFSRLTRSLRPIIANLLEELRVSSFVPEKFEFKVTDDSLAAYAADGETRSVRLFGVVDRIDIFRENGVTYLRVIDYKTGNKKFDLNDVAYGLNLQMLLYLFAVTEYYKKQTGGAQAAGVLYFHAFEPIVPASKNDSDEAVKAKRDDAFRRNGLVRSEYGLIAAMDSTLDPQKGSASKYIPVAYKKGGGFKYGSSTATREQFALIEKGVKKIVSEMAGALKEGSIEIYPYENASGFVYCKYCEYRSVCRFDKNRGNKTRKLRKRRKEEIFEMFGGDEFQNGVD